MEGPVGFEPTIKELQSTALPLGYDPEQITNQVYQIIFKKEIKIYTFFHYYFMQFSIIWQFRKDKNLNM